MPTRPPIETLDSGTSLSRNSSGDALDSLNENKTPGTPGVPIPIARDGFFGYSDEKTIHSVRVHTSCCGVPTLSANNQKNLNVLRPD